MTSIANTVAFVLDSLGAELIVGDFVTVDRKPAEIVGMNDRRGGEIVLRSGLCLTARRYTRRATPPPSAQ